MVSALSIGDVFRDDRRTSLMDQRMRVQVLGRDIVARAKPACRCAAKRFRPSLDHLRPGVAIEEHRCVLHHCPARAPVRFVQQRVRIRQRGVPRARVGVVLPARRRRPFELRIQPQAPVLVDEIRQLHRRAEQPVVFDVDEPARQPIDAMKVRHDRQTS